MKTFLIVSLIVSSLAFSQGTQLKLHDYQLQVNTPGKTKSGKIAFAVVRPVKNPKEESTFGFWLSNNTDQSFVFLRLNEGQKTILSVTAKDFAAKAKVQSTGLKTTAVYSSGTGANAVTVTWESNIVADETMPLGKTVTVALKVKSVPNKTYSAMLTLFGDGYLRPVGANGVLTTRVEKGKADYPFVLISGIAGTAVTTAAGEQKGPGKTVVVSSENVSSAGAETEVLSFRVNATTVKNFEKSAIQASHLEVMNSSKKETTELALINSADRMNPFPGDTVTYSVLYHNIGTAFAQDATITNDVPANMTYVENSAAGEDCEITVVRSTVTPPQQSAVISIQWKITKKILPGEEGIVSFKAVVR